MMLRLLYLCHNILINKAQTDTLFVKFVFVMGKHLYELEANACKLLWKMFWIVKFGSWQSNVRNLPNLRKFTFLCGIFKMSISISENFKLKKKPMVLYRVFASRQYMIVLWHVICRWKYFKHPKITKSCCRSCCRSCYGHVSRNSRFQWGKYVL